MRAAALVDERLQLHQGGVHLCVLPHGNHPSECINALSLVLTRLHGRGRADGGGPGLPLRLLLEEPVRCLHGGNEGVRKDGVDVRDPGSSLLEDDGAGQTRPRGQGAA